jgi:opacity protein-like surface antigen
MDFRKSIAAAALAFAVTASPAAFAFVRHEVTNPILTPEQRASRTHLFDRNRDGVVTRSEWRSGQAAFERHDTNRDGVITAADKQTTSAKRFHGLDRNRDGIVSRSEWRGNTSSFRVQDRNRDGVLSGTELR